MNEKTEWKGLWRNRAGVYSGQVLKKADIPKYARLIVRKNRFYDADSNRPMFVYTFAQGEASDAITIKTEKPSSGARWYTREQIEEILERSRYFAEDYVYDIYGYSLNIGLPNVDDILEEI
jgi:hypothetical protein